MGAFGKNVPKPSVLFYWNDDDAWPKCLERHLSEDDKKRLDEEKKKNPPMVVELAPHADGRKRYAGTKQLMFSMEYTHEYTDAVYLAWNAFEKRVKGKLSWVRVNMAAQEGERIDWNEWSDAAEHAKNTFLVDWVRDAQLLSVCEACGVPIHVPL